MVQFLIFGPMLGLLLFIIYITRDQSIPMVAVVSAGTSLGVTAQLLILHKIYRPAHRSIILGSCVALAAVLLPWCFIYLGFGSLLRLGLIASLFVAYALLLRFLSGKNA